MNSLPRPLAIFLVFIAAITVYAPSLGGASLWDDNHFIFWRYQFQPDYSVAHMWKAHLWPFFDTITLLLYKWWGAQTMYWRLLNLALHAGNAYLIATIVGRWREKLFWPILILFLIHPLNVLSVASIIQLKTVLSASFLLLSIVTFLKWDQQRKASFYLLAFALFALSLATKSSSLLFPLIGLFGLFISPFVTKTRLAAFLPFVLLASFSIYRIKSSSIIQERTDFTEGILLRSPQERVPNALEADRAISKSSLVLANLGRYMSYPYYPWPLAIAHGKFMGKWSAPAVGGLVLSMALFLYALIRRDRLIIFLLMAQVLSLMLFLGFITAPYMAYSSVSEQHLYFMLPFALVLQLALWQKLKSAWQPWGLGLALLVLMALTLDYTPAFLNEEKLFRRVLQQRPADPFALINLAAYYMRAGQKFRAMKVLDSGIAKAELDPEINQDPLFFKMKAIRDMYALQ